MCSSDLGNQVTSFTGQIGSSGIGPYPITGLAAPGSGGLGSGGDNAWPLTESGIVSTFVAAGNPIVLSIANPPNTIILTPPSNVAFTFTGIGFLLGGEFTYAPVPEPSTYAAFATLGLAGFGVWRRVRR